MGIYKSLASPNRVCKYCGGNQSVGTKIPKFIFNIFCELIPGVKPCNLIIKVATYVNKVSQTLVINSGCT
jgi:hypothetical protein